MKTLYSVVMVDTRYSFRHVNGEWLFTNERAAKGWKRHIYRECGVPRQATDEEAMSDFECYVTIEPITAFSRSGEVEPAGSAGPFDPRW